MNRREVLAFFSLTVLQGLFTFSGLERQKYYLNTIYLCLPPKMDAGEFERRRRGLVDLASFERFNREMRRRGLLLSCHVQITDREATWYNLFRDRAAYLYWEKHRPKYSSSDEFKFVSTEREVRRGDLEVANLDFLMV